MFGRLITLLIILLNGFFVAAEFALVKVRGSQIDVLIKQGNATAKLIKSIVQQLDNYLSACQLGITITSLALGWVAEPLIATQFIALNNFFHVGLSEITAHAIAIPLTFVLITILHIVLGELAPKSLAIRDSLSIAGLVAHPLYVFYKIFRPFIRLLNKSSSLLLSIFGIHGVSEEQSHSEEELRMIVVESEEDGQINASERELIQNVFEFDNRQVSEIMTPVNKLFSYNINTRSNKSIEIMIQEGYSRIPLYEDSINNIIGRILLKDIFPYYLNGIEKIDINKLIRPIEFVPENMKIAECLKHLQKSHHHIAIVTSEYGTTLGIITLEDIIEELVGDIQDESDVKETIVTNTNDLYTIDATASINDANEFLPVSLPIAEEYDTVAGYIHTLFGRIPSQNEVITTSDYLITVTKTKKQRVEQISIRCVINKDDMI